jgi:hypothetical protein
MADFSLATLFTYTDNEYVGGLHRLLLEQIVIDQDKIVTEFVQRYPKYDQEERGKEFRAALWLADSEIHLRYDEICLYNSLFKNKKPLKKFVHQIVASIMSMPKSDIGS